METVKTVRNGQFQSILHLYAITFEAQLLNGKWPVTFSIINYTFSKLHCSAQSIAICFHVVGLNILLLKSYYFDVNAYLRKKIFNDVF